MKDFREVSTMELLYNVTTKMEIKMKKFEELFKSNMLKFTLKRKDKEGDEIEEDDRIIEKEKIKKLSYEQLRNEADEGDEDAQYNMGNYYLTFERDKLEGISKAFGWYKKASQNGSKEAQYNLACLYIDGVDIDLDEEEDEKEEQAFIWFEKSAEQGFIKSKFC